MTKGTKQDNSTHKVTLAKATSDLRQRSAKMVLSDVFIQLPTSSSLSSFVLGPAFESVISSGYSNFFPLLENEIPLLLEPQLRWYGWDTHRTIKSWPKANKDWIIWLDRVQSKYGDLWKQIGIFEAIQLSRYDYPIDKSILSSALCFWSISTNSFHFPCGLMAPTVLDVCAITGLLPYGEEVNAILPSTDLDIIYDLAPRNSLAYGQFLSQERGSGLISDQEHCSFLLFWICKFLFCVNSIKIIKGYVPIAVALASGRKLALAPFVLACLYRGCHDLWQKKISNSVGGPFWLCQMWLHSYFPEVSPKLCEVDEKTILSYGHLLTKIETSSQTFSSCFKFFYSLKVDRAPSLFVPFSERKYGPAWFRELSSENQSSSSSASEEALENQRLVWASFLIARHLHVGGVVNTLVQSKCGVEIYSPNQFARQFGLVQAIPFPFFSDVVEDVLNRDTLTEDIQVKTICKQYVDACEQFRFLPFVPNPRYTEYFETWWSTHMSSLLSEPVESFIKKLSSENKIKEEPMVKSSAEAGSGSNVATKRKNSGGKAASMIQTSLIMALLKPKEEEGEGIDEEEDGEEVVAEGVAEKEDCDSSTDSDNPFLKRHRAINWDKVEDEEIEKEDVEKEDELEQIGKKEKKVKGKEGKAQKKNKEEEKKGVEIQGKAQKGKYEGKEYVPKENRKWKGEKEKAKGKEQENGKEREVEKEKGKDRKLAKRITEGPKVLKKAPTQTTRRACARGITQKSSSGPTAQKMLMEQFDFQSREIEQDTVLPSDTRQMYTVNFSQNQSGFVPTTAMPTSASNSTTASMLIVLPPDDLDLVYNELEDYLSSLSTKLASGSGLTGQSTGCVISSEIITQAKDLFNELLKKNFATLTESSWESTIIEALSILANPQSGFSTEQNQVLIDFQSKVSALVSSFKCSTEVKKNHETFQANLDALVNSSRGNAENNLKLKLEIHQLAQEEEVLRKKMEEIRAKKAELQSQRIVLATKTQTTRKQIEEQSQQLPIMEVQRQSAEKELANIDTAWATFKAHFL